MATEVKMSKCPICGHEVQGREHSRMGARITPEGPVEYWACFQERDVFSCKSDSEDSDD